MKLNSSHEEDENIIIKKRKIVDLSETGCKNDNSLENVKKFPDAEKVDPPKKISYLNPDEESREIALPEKPIEDGIVISSLFNLLKIALLRGHPQIKSVN